MKKHLSTFVTLGFLALFIGYGLLHREIFTSLTHVAIWALVIIIIGKLIDIYTTGLFAQWTVEAFTDRMTLAESFKVGVLTTIGNFFGPLFGGLGFRAIYLKKYHKLPYAKFTATLIAYFLIMFQFNNLLAIGSLLVLPRSHESLYTLLFFILWLIGFGILSIMRLPKRERLARLERNKFARIIIKVLYDIETGWKLILSRRQLLVRMAVLAVINLVALYATNYIEFAALHIHTTPAAMGLYTAIVQASMLISLTPGAVGIREAALILLGLTLGISNQQIIQVAILDRGINFVLLGILALSTRHSRLKQPAGESAAV